MPPPEIALPGGVPAAPPMGEDEDTDDVPHAPVLPEWDPLPLAGAHSDEEVNPVEHINVVEQARAQAAMPAHEPEQIVEQEPVAALVIEPEAEPLLAIPASNVVPLSPPPHPLLAEVDSSPEFHTPPAASHTIAARPYAIMPNAPGHPPQPNSCESQEDSRPGLLTLPGVAQGHNMQVLKVRRKRPRRSIDFLPTNLDVHSDDPGTSEDDARSVPEVKFDDVNSDAASSDTVQYPRADEKVEQKPASSPTGTAPLLPHTPSIILTPVVNDRIVARRPSEEDPAPQLDLEVQNICLQVPSDIQALPGTSAGTRELVTKIRAKDERPRASSMEAGYARPAATRPKSRWQDRVPRASSAPKTSSTAESAPLTRHAERGTDGKFAKKSTTGQKSRKATEAGEDVEEAQPQLPK